MSECYCYLNLTMKHCASVAWLRNWGPRAKLGAVLPSPSIKRHYRVWAIARMTSTVSCPMSKMTQTSYDIWWTSGQRLAYTDWWAGGTVVRSPSEARLCGWKSGLPTKSRSGQQEAYTWRRATARRFIIIHRIASTEKTSILDTSYTRGYSASGELLVIHVC